VSNGATDLLRRPTHLVYHLDMTSAQFKRWLEKQGCTFEPAKGGHLRVFLGKQASILPMHGSSKEIGKGLEHRIKKDLGLK
jgi:mRNA interferase HicA